MVEENVILPGVLVVAIETLRPLRSLVGIFVFVARQAVGLQSDIENWFKMAGEAFERLVRASQCIAGSGVMVEAGILPKIVFMTGATIVAEMAVVIVIFQVTAHTRDIEFVRERLFTVTITTDEFTMPAVECKSGVAGMVEAGIGPARRRMAIAALLATAALVDVVLSVAAVTGRFGIQKSLVFVASAALRGGMIADQRVIRRVVVEFHVQPLGRRMAVAAFSPHRLAMDIVRLVAAIALCRCIPVF